MPRRKPSNGSFTRCESGERAREGPGGPAGPAFAVLATAEPGGKARDSAERGRVTASDQCGGTASGVLKFAEATRPSYALMAEKLALPLAQFEQEFERETAKQAGNPVFKLFFPALAKVRRAQARADVRRAHPVRGGSRSDSTAPTP